MVDYLTKTNYLGVVTDRVEEEINKPLTVEAGGAAPWFGYEENGIQYELPERVITLEKAGVLTKIN